MSTRLDTDTQYLLPDREDVIAASLESGNPAMLECLRLASAVSTEQMPVLLCGESGVGKSLLAKYIHARSPKNLRPCLNLRCAGLGEGELRSRLFGGTAGATAGQPGGMLAAAAGGTLILDGVNQLSSLAQKWLLRTLADHAASGRRLGVRLLSTIGDGVPGGRFYLDELGDVLSEVLIRVPPLRRRREDVGRLAERALMAANKTLGRKVSGFSSSARNFLLHYDFPGNVRELFIIVNQAVRFCRRDRLYVEDFGMVMDEAPDEAPLFSGGRLLSLSEMERRHINRVLLRTGWKKSAAARILQISETQLERKIRLYALEQAR